METNNNQNQVIADEVAALRAELERIRLENEALKSAPKQSVGGLSVTPKGTVRVPNIGMMGLCLYKLQWERLFAFFEIPVPTKLAEFFEANADKISQAKPEGHKSIFADAFAARAEAKKAGKPAPSVIVRKQG